MDTILIIDGYNIIYSWDELANIAKYSLEEARDKLIEIIINYAGYKGYKIIIVFDAYQNNSMQIIEKHKPNVEIVYSGKNETADSVIEKMVYDLLKNKDFKVFVATMDSAEQTMIFSYGAYRVTTRELLNEIKQAQFQLKSIKNYENWKLYSRLTRDVAAKLERLRREK